MAAKHAYPAGQFFEGYPRPFAIYKEIKKHLESPGPVKTEAAKTQVGFGTKNKFAWLWLPQKWVKSLPKDIQSVTLRFDVPEKIESGRITKAIKTRYGSWTHEVVLDRPEELDSEFRAWLRESYLFSKE